MDTQINNSNSNIDKITNLSLRKKYLVKSITDEYKITLTDKDSFHRYEKNNDSNIIVAHNSGQILVSHLKTLCENANDNVSNVLKNMINALTPNCANELISKCHIHSYMSCVHALNDAEIVESLIKYHESRIAN